jgi:hypothetical protein
MFLALFVIGFLFVPSLAFAWGPLTHAYLANEILSYLPLLPAGVAVVIRKYKQDFLYGNLMADMIIGKKYLPDDKSSHNWDVAMKLLEQARSGQEESFVYGYLSHLAADTVAHETLTEDMQNMGHAWMEMKADSMIKKTYWLQSVTISKSVQNRHDRFLEESLDRFVFSFKTNKRIYKGIVFFSLLNKKRKRGIDKDFICCLHEESMGRIVDVLKNGRSSVVLGRNPL